MVLPKLLLNIPISANPVAFLAKEIFCTLVLLQVGQWGMLGVGFSSTNRQWHLGQNDRALFANVTLHITHFFIYLPLLN